MTAISPTLCMPCYQATKSTHPDIWHRQCPGRFGHYPGWTAKVCKCDCERSRKWRAA